MWSRANPGAKEPILHLIKRSEKLPEIISTDIG